MGRHAWATPVATAFVLAGAAGVLVSCASSDSTPSPTNSLSQSASPDANSAAPTPTAATVSPSQSAAPSTDPTPSASAAPLVTVTVVLTNYGSTSGEVYGSAIVPELQESNGICTLEATDGDRTYSATESAAESTSAMNCGRVTIAVPEGEWSLTMSYASELSAGVSDTVAVSVR